MSMKSLSKKHVRIGLLAAVGLVATMLPYGTANATQTSTTVQAAGSAPEILGSAPTVARTKLLAPSRRTSRDRVVTFRGEALPDRAAGQRIAFNLFDDAAFEGTVDHRQVNEGYTEWRGSLSGVELGSWAATRTGGIFMLTVHSPEGVYEVTPATEGATAYRVAQVRQDQGDEGESDTRPASSFKAPPVKGGDASKLTYRMPAKPAARTTPSTMRVGRSTPGALQRKDSKKMFDIALVWSPQAAAAYGGDGAMAAAAAQAVALSNQIYANSGVKTSMRLVGAANTGVNEVGDFETDLKQLTKGKAGYSNTRSYANSVHADAVGLFIQSNGSYCGLAWLNAKSKRMATSVVSPECISYFTVTHEVGHNQGATHDRYVDRNYYYKYGHGYVNLAGQWRTVMAYPTECVDNGIPTGCTRVGYMSNPRVSIAGSKGGTKRYENNAKVLNKTAKRIARLEQSQIYGAKVKIKGKVKAKKKVRAKTKKGKWSPGRVKIKFQWFVNGTHVKNGAKLKLRKEWKGGTVAVAAIGRKRGYADVVIWSKTKTI